MYPKFSKETLFFLAERWINSLPRDTTDASSLLDSEQVRTFTWIMKVTALGRKNNKVYRSFMPRGINHSRQDFRNKLPLHTDYPVTVCYGICCGFPCTIWYLSASEHDEEHRLLSFHAAVPAQSNTCAQAASRWKHACAVRHRQLRCHHPPATGHQKQVTFCLEATRLPEALSLSEQSPLEYRTVRIWPRRHSVKACVLATIWWHHIIYTVGSPFRETITRTQQRKLSNVPIILSTIALGLSRHRS